MMYGDLRPECLFLYQNYVLMSLRLFCKGGKIVSSSESFFFISLFPKNGSHCVVSVAWSVSPWS
jgi:hypothetical protein